MLIFFLGATSATFELPPECFQEWLQERLRSGARNDFSSKLKLDIVRTEIPRFICELLITRYKRRRDSWASGDVLTMRLWMLWIFLFPGLRKFIVEVETLQTQCKSWKSNWR